MPIPKSLEGFTITPYVDSNALRMDGRMVAHSATLPSGSARLALKERTANLRYVFVASSDAADRYMAQWCIRRKAEIRELYRGLGGPG